MRFVEKDGRGMKGMPLVLCLQRLSFQPNKAWGTFACRTNYVRCSPRFQLNRGSLCILKSDLVGKDCSLMLSALPIPRKAATSKVISCMNSF